MRIELIKEYYDSDEYLRLLRARAEILAKCEDPIERAYIISTVWSVDPVRFIEDVLFLKLVEYNNAIKPFFLFEYQKEIIWKLVAYEQSESDDIEVLVDKLRAMGLTWLICAYMYWRWMFTPNWSGFILSRTETEVDDGTDDPANSIFGKIRFFIKYTPGWLIPEGFTPKSKKGTHTDSTLRIMNPQMGTSINGSSTNANAGRSRRYSFTFIDECFFIDHFKSVWRALQSVSRVKIYVSSVKQGKVASDFKELCISRNTYVTLDYKQHPWKDEAWYNDKVKLAEFDAEVLKEISVDYSVNINDQYYPEIRQSLVVPLQYNPRLPLYAFMDFGKQDLTVLGWAQFTGQYLDILECYANKQKPLKFYVPMLNPEVTDPSVQYNEAQVEFANIVRHWAKPKGYFGETAHFMKVMPLNVSIAGELFKSGIRLLANTKASKYEPRRYATSLLLPKTRFNADSDRVMELYDALMTSRYTHTSAPTSRDGVKKPVHDDEIADFRSAFENLCVNIPRIIRSQNHDVGENFRNDGFASGIMRYLRI